MNTSSSSVRKSFLDYFAAQGCKVVSSDSLIPSGDPTLLFTSAGMVQFKKHFLGQSKDSFTRATTCQKCFRTSDIDQVGQTNRHLTFFEMLGNFSFGDYFKKEAIAWAWDFLTNRMQLPKDRLYITIYKDDDEAFEIWKKIVPESRIIRMGDETNFWNMGPTGPCGPCSEILFDLGEEMSCGKPDCGPACSCNRYLEVWNLVFTQFDRQPDGSLKNLPRKNIDTGMGLERLVAVVNGKKNVFETDLFVPIMEEISKLLDVRITEKNISAFRMMADHTRAVTFLVADGILPSNEGRGYVLRRILRRALRQGKLFGVNEPFLYKVTATVIEIMKSAYPELVERREHIASITKMEEEKFLETLESGTRILEELIDRYRGTAAKGAEAMAAKHIIPGDEVFKLYDTYGFPPDLTKEIARENGVGIDEPGFATAQKRAQEKSRAAWAGSGEKDMTFYSKLHKELGDTAFRGYELLKLSARVLGLVKDGKKVSSLSVGEEGEIILNETPFYAESGGQVGDRGSLAADKLPPMTAEVLDVTKPSGALFVHAVKVTKGTISEGDIIDAQVDGMRRYRIMRHHTATHLLHRALRQVLGTHVTQAGSLVTPDYFRFDFTHLAGMKPEELKSVEEIVNKAVRANMPVCIEQMKIDEARKRGAMALFGEKYGDVVRSVSVMETDKPFSMELCGGTHVARTGDIGMFKIRSESSVSAGTRRIEAVAGDAAEKYFDSLLALLDDAAAKLKTSPNEILGRIDKVLGQQKDLERDIAKLKSQLASGGTADLMKDVREISGVRLLAARVTDIDLNSLRDLSDNLKTKLGSGIVILANAEADKVSFLVSVTPDQVKVGYHAGKIAKNLAALIGGSGGGRPDFAQGGGKDPSKVDQAIVKIAEMLK